MSKQKGPTICIEEREGLGPTKSSQNQKKEMQGNEFEEKRPFEGALQVSPHIQNGAPLPLLTPPYCDAGRLAKGWLNIAVEGLRNMRPSPTHTAKKGAMISLAESSSPAFLHTCGSVLLITPQ